MTDQLTTTPTFDEEALAQLEAEFLRGPSGLPAAPVAAPAWPDGDEPEAVVTIYRTRKYCC